MVVLDISGGDKEIAGELQAELEESRHKAIGRENVTVFTILGFAPRKLLLQLYHQD